MLEMDAHGVNDSAFFSSFFLYMSLTTLLLLTLHLSEEAIRRLDHSNDDGNRIKSIFNNRVVLHFK